MAADRHTHNFRKCSHASVGLAQARPNKQSHDNIRLMIQSAKILQLVHKCISTKNNINVNGQTRPNYISNYWIIAIATLNILWTKQLQLKCETYPGP